jgi:predicted TIM-barrel fold metal-dependent hydrolase
MARSRTFPALAALVWLAALVAACGARPAAPSSNPTATPTPAPTSIATPTTSTSTTATATPTDSVAEVRREAASWRADKRLVDLHMHVERNPERYARAVKIMDAVGVGVGVNLSGGYVTETAGKYDPAKPKRNLRGEAPLELSTRLASAHPGRFVQYMNLDYERWDDPDFAAQAVRQVERGAALGAAGFKEFKRLGLYLRDKKGVLLAIDDARLDPMWTRLGELGMPVSIHVADPRAFWLPYDDKNERWDELRDHKDWWFGDPKRYPPREKLLEALSRVIERHRGTTFVCVHFANNAEDLDWVERELDRHPNMMADLAARVPEIGRHPPDRVRRLFEKHQDRILFATDFQVYDTLILGSSGSGPPPSDADAVAFFEKHWRWLETRDAGFEHMTPIQGKWTISAIGLSPPALRKIYFDNARKLLGRALGTKGS